MISEEKYRVTESDFYLSIPYVTSQGKLQILVESLRALLIVNILKFHLLKFSHVKNFYRNFYLPRSPRWAEKT